ncbi:MAG: hypothetical protein OXC55_02560 [Chloroflexi bacterium]|nr:hypothetical protein [Chloroflexota bacterium]
MIIWTIGAYDTTPSSLQVDGSYVMSFYGTATTHGKGTGEYETIRLCLTAIPAGTR